MMFNEQLKKCRKNNNKTQKEIAEYLGIAERAYQNYEYGNREPDIEKIKMLCQFFDVSADYLLGLSDNPQINK